jgi:soluble lytic murein transglycosylase-like protein/TolA-binding protein
MMQNMNIMILCLLAARIVLADEAEFNPYLAPDTGQQKQCYPRINDAAWRELSKMKFKIALARYNSIKYSCTGEETGIAQEIDTLMIAFPNAAWIALGHKVLGDIYFHAEDYDKAAMHLQALAGLDSMATQQASFRLKLGLSLKEIGRGKEAVVILEQCSRDTIIKDYLTFWLGEAYASAGCLASAVTCFEKIADQNTHSLLYDRALYQAGKLCFDSGDLTPALARFRQLLNSKAREKYKVEILYYLGMIHQKRKNYAEAEMAYVDIMQHHPASEWADRARQQLSGMAGSVDETDRIKNDFYGTLVLAAHGQHEEAVQRYRVFLEKYSNSAWAAEAKAGLGASLQHLKHYAEAESVFRELMTAQAENILGADAQFSLARLFREKKLDREAMEEYRKFALSHPAHKRAPKALWIVAWYEEAKNDFPAAVRDYEELSRQFARTDQGREAAWRAGFCSYKQGDYDAAITRFEKMRPNAVLGTEHQAGYWIGKCLIKKGQKDKAREIFKKLYKDFPKTYYSIRAGLALDNLAGPYPGVPEEIGRTNAFEAFKASLQDFWNGHAAKFKKKALPLALEDKQHYLKGLYFIEMDLPEQAARELLAVEDRQIKNLPFLKKMTELYLDHGLVYRADRAVYKLWESLNGEEAEDSPLEELRPIYPLLYYQAISAQCRQNQNVDPFFVLAVIRQESNFNSQVVSPAKAVGLMQIMPSTGGILAKELKVPDFDVRRLYDPYINIRLGVHFLSSQLARYKNKKEFTLAVYNGGERSFSRALGIHADQDMDVFVEEIEFRETRNYVKTVMRNYWMYYELWKNLGKTETGTEALRNCELRTAE